MCESFSVSFFFLCILPLVVSTIICSSDANGRAFWSCFQAQHPKAVTAAGAVGGPRADGSRLPIVRLKKASVARVSFPPTGLAHPLVGSLAPDAVEDGAATTATATTRPQSVLLQDCCSQPPFNRRATLRCSVLSDERGDPFCRAVRVLHPVGSLRRTGASRGTSAADSRGPQHPPLRQPVRWGHLVPVL